MIDEDIDSGTIATPELIDTDREGLLVSDTNFGCPT